MPTGSSARLAAHIPNLESLDPRAHRALAGRPPGRATRTSQRGDPYGGSLALDQNFLWRPFPASPGHRTPVERLWQIGASTWPGPGLGAGSGTLVAEALLRPGTGERLRRRFRLAGT